MKKCKPFLPHIAAIGGVLAACLRQWTLSGGVDEKALYPAAHPGWIGYLVLSAAMALLFLFVSRTESEPAPECKKVGLALHFLAAIGIFAYSLSSIDPTDLFQLIVSGFGFVSAAAMLLGLVQQWKKQTLSALTYALPCLYFVLLMFQSNLIYGGEPEMIRFLPQFLAMVTAALACYQLWGKAVGLDNEKNRLFWQCLAGYLCIATLPGSHIMYAFVGAWLLVGAFQMPATEEVPPEAPVQE